MLGASAWLGGTSHRGVAGRFARDVRTPPRISVKRRAALQSSFVNAPLGFEVNRGQVDSRVQYIARRGPLAVFLTRSGAVLALSHQDETPGLMSTSHDPRPSLAILKRDARRNIHTDAVKLSFEGANPAAPVAASGRLKVATNYFIGNDPARWHRDVPSFSRVVYQSIYPGVDLAYYGNKGRLEYDLDVAAGADPGRIRMKVGGARRLALNHDGDLVATLGGEDAVIARPVAYQQIKGKRRAVDARFKLSGDEIRIALGNYDRSAPLVVDPAIMYSTFLGGMVAEIQALAVDPSGDAYAAGWTCCASDFPTVGGIQTSLTGVDNAFVTEFNPTGTSIIYSTYLGGNQMDIATGIAIDTAGNAYVTGYTDSPDFPTQPSGGTSLGGGFDAFVTALKPGGNALLYSMYLGGTADDLGAAIAADPAGTSAYVVGQTFSTDFPETNNAFLTSNPSGGAVSEGFLTRIDAPTASDPNPNVFYSSYFGGAAPTSSTSPNGLAFLTGAAFGGPTGQVYVVGGGGGGVPTTLGQPFGGALDAIVADFDTTLSGASSLLFSQFLGGSGIDVATSAATTFGCTANCSVVIGGYTFSPDNADGDEFNGLEDGFIAKVDSRNGVSNFQNIGTSSYDEIDAVAQDSAGNALAGGFTFRSDEIAQTDQLAATPSVAGAFYESRDIGKTFQSIPWPSQKFGSGISMAIDNSVTPEVIYVGTNEGGLLQSLDGGQTFQPIGSFGGIPITSMGLAVLPVGAQGPRTLYVAANSTTYISPNAGTTFGQLFALPVGANEDPPTSAYFLAADFNFVRNPGTPSTSAFVWQGNNNGLWVSTSAGATWTEATGLTTSSETTQVFSGTNDGKTVFYAGTNKGIFISDDFGMTFAPTNVDIDAIVSMAIDTTSTPPLVYAGTFGDGIYESSDGFNTFQHTIIEPNARLHYLAMDDKSGPPATLYVGVGDNQHLGTMWKTTDGGVTYDRLGGDDFNQPCCFLPITVSLGILYTGNFLEQQALLEQTNPQGNTSFQGILAGSSDQSILALGADSANNGYAAGFTFSSNYPNFTSAGGAQLKFGGANGGFVNGFVTKVGFTGKGTLTVPQDLEFTNKQQLRTVSKPQTIVVSNTGTNTLYLGYVRTSGSDAGDFQIVPGISTKIRGAKGKKITITPCGATIPVGGQCGVSLVFQPFGLGQRVADLVLPSNGSNATQEVVVFGKGKKGPKN
jgi:hypothetical protein